MAVRAAGSDASMLNDMRYSYLFNSSSKIVEVTHTHYARENKPHEKKVVSPPIATNYVQQFYI